MKIFLRKNWSMCIIKKTNKKRRLQEDQKYQ